MNPYSLAHDEGEAIWMFDALDTIKADAARTGGALSVVEALDFEGSSVPVHTRDAWDAGFYVLEGEYTFVIADRTLAASSGDWVFVPRGTPQAWRCDSAQGRLLYISVPGGMEAFYREVGEAIRDRTQLPPRSVPDVASLSAIAEKHGIRIVGPPPGG